MDGKVGMLRLTSDLFIMAHHVCRVASDIYDEDDGCGTVLIYGLDGAVASVDREDNSMLPISELVELIARTTMHVLRTGDDVDLRPRMLKPKY